MSTSPDARDRLFPHELVQDFANGIGSVFVGAGASVGAGLPGWADLLRHLTKRQELPAGASYLDVAQYYENAYGRDTLVTRLWEILGPEARDPTPIHTEVISLPVRRIFTTNLDTLLETAAVRGGRSFRMISNATAVVSASRDYLTIFKLHGDLNQPHSYVITSDDYEGYAETYPTSVLVMSYALHTSTVLFVGYSFNDVDLRMIIRSVASQRGRFVRQHYALVIDPTPDAEAELWRRKIRVIPLEAPAGDMTRAVSHWLHEFSNEIAKYRDAKAWLASSPDPGSAKRPAAAASAMFPIPDATYDVLIGRESAIAEICATFKKHEHGLTLVSGLPGAGKTSVALEILRRYSRDRRDAAASTPQHPDELFDYVVWLAEARRTLGDLVTALLLTVNGIPPSRDGDESRAEARKLLLKHRILIVADNFGLKEDPELIKWLADVPLPSQALVLTSGPVTSGFASATTVALGGLAPQDAQLLLRHHAPEVVDKEPIAVGSLIALTAGNPGALLLAVGALRGGGTLQELVTELGGNAPAVGSTEVLSRLFASSWATLSEAAEALAVSLALFSSSQRSVDVEALAAVSGRSGPEFDSALAEIRQANLAEQRADGSVVMHPLARLYAQRQAADPDAAVVAIRERQVTYYLSFLRRNIVRSRPIVLPPYWDALVSRSMSAVDPQWPVIEEVMEWARGQTRWDAIVEFVMLAVHYMDSRFLNRQRFDYVNAAVSALKAAGRKSEEALLRIDALGWTYMEEGRLEDAKREIGAGLHVADELATAAHTRTSSADVPAHRDLQALASAWLARIETEQGNVVTAEPLVQAALAMNTSPWVSYRVHFAAGDVNYSRGRHERALQFYQSAANQVEQYGGEEGYQIETRLGLAWLGLGNLQEAERNFSRIADVGEITVGQVHALYGMALIAVARGDHARAQALAKDVLERLPSSTRATGLLKHLDQLRSLVAS